MFASDFLYCHNRTIRYLSSRGEGRQEAPLYISNCNSAGWAVSTGTSDQIAV